MCALGEPHISRGLARMGDEVKSKRWFSWVDAALFHHRVWFTRLFFIVAVAMNRLQKLVLPKTVYQQQPQLL